MKSKISQLRRFAICFSLIIYVLLLANILFFKYVSIIEIINPYRTPFRSLNLVPLKTILNYFSSDFSIRVAFLNVFGNIAIFVPLGIYLQLLKKRKVLF